jgi:mRNA interferase RelE/StbE
VAYRIEFKDSARRELAALPLAVRKRIDARILALAENPRPHGAEKLTSSDDLYRLRVGDYRVIYQIQDKVLLVVIVKVGHRREVYRSL